MNFTQFKLLTDENIDREVVVFLRQVGFDVLDVKEAGWFSRSDTWLLEFALQESRVVISQDSDFGTLVFRQQKPFYGILFLRPGHQEPDVHIVSLRTLLLTDIELAIPFVLVIENTQQAVRIRVRQL